MEKSTKREKADKFSEANVKEIFHTIDKDNSGEITMKVIQYHIIIRPHSDPKPGGCQGLQEDECDGQTRGGGCGGVAQAH